MGRVVEASILLLSLSYIFNAILGRIGARGIADLSMLILFSLSILLMSTRVRRIILLPILGSFLGFISEFISLRYSFPFGSYRYLAFEGFTLQGVPIPVIIAWGVYVYTCYLASLSISRRMSIITASSLMVLLDMALDPVMVERGFWVWEAGGEWFGVPLTNYLGWFLVSSISLILYNLAGEEPPEVGSTSYIPYVSGFLPILSMSGASSWLPSYISISIALILPIVRAIK
jgi:putative membrane protein